MNTSVNQTAVLQPNPIRPLHPNSGHAVAYADRGWAVHPSAPNSKMPLKGSRGLHEAIHDRDVLKEVFAEADLNVGIRTGEISKLVVVDIDCHNDDANGYDSLKELPRQGFKLPTVATREAADSSSIDCSSWRSITIRCATYSSSPTRSRRRCRWCCHGGGDTLRASTGLVLNALGELLTDQGKSAQMDTPLVPLATKWLSDVFTSYFVCVISLPVA